MWTWTPSVQRRLEAAVLTDLLGGVLTVRTAGGVPLVTIPLTGQKGTVSARATDDGVASTVEIHAAGGEKLGSIPAQDVLDTVHLEEGAKVTLTLRVA